jgi:redox-sensitive bicupin YhaK (pirin superfamily)
MISIRLSDERGHENYKWLDTFHTFSFNNYYDPRYMGFRQLRVINEDRVAPGRGFGTHSHRDMEIITYVLEGALAHKDSIGTSSVIRPGEVQRMTAGTGVSHSEYNHSPTEPVHFLQIWIEPERQNLEPGYEQRAYSAEEKQGKLRLVASRDAREGSVTIHQNADLYAALLAENDEVTHRLESGRSAWLQIISGEVTINGTTLKGGDGAAISDEPNLKIVCTTASEFLLFDLN